MLEFFMHHFPALIILIPIFFAAIILILPNKKLSNYLFLLSNLLGFSLVFIVSLNFTKEMTYDFGDWPPDIGINFKIDYFSLFIVQLFYLSTSLFSISSVGLFNNKIQGAVLPSRKHIPNALMLISSAGIAGLLITNDIFNLYVFLEIASISSYGLFAIGRSKVSFINAFEYLVMGTIGATLILVSIGFMYAAFGSLNLDFIKTSMLNAQFRNSGIAISFLVGVFIKLSIFPIHLWKTRAYESVSSLIANFFIAITGLAFIALLYKFRFLDHALMPDQKLFIKYVSYLTMIFGSYCALRTETYKEIVIYSSISSVGYYLLLWPFDGLDKSYIFCQFLFSETLIKLSLFMVPSAIGIEKMSIRNLIGIHKKSRYIAFILIITLLNSGGLPPTLAFFNKLYFASSVLAVNIFAFIIFLISSAFGILYNLRIARQIVKTSDIENTYAINYKPVIGITIINLMLVVALFRSDIIMDIARTMQGGE